MKWAPVWTDEEMLKIVVCNNVSVLSKLREELNQGSVKIKLPFLEYSTGKQEEIQGLPFSKEIELMTVLEANNVKNIMTKINSLENFQPFVTLFEGSVGIFGSVIRIIRSEIDYLLNFFKMPPAFKHELAELRNYSDEELAKACIDRINSNTAGNPNQFSAQMRKYKNVLRNEFPDIDKMIERHIISTKPALQAKFKNKEYLVYLAGDEDEFHKFYVYFPVEAISDLPNAPGFPARIIGIVFFNPNPPEDGLSNFALIAVSLFLQYKELADGRGL